MAAGASALRQLTLTLGPVLSTLSKDGQDSSIRDVCGKGS